MASKKTGRNTGRDGVEGDAAPATSASETSAPEAEAVAVSDPDGASRDAPETVDAEIVDEERRDEPMAAAPGDTGRTGATDGTGGGGPTDGGDAPRKKKGAGGFIVGLLVLAAVLAALAYIFRDDILGADEPAVAETAPGVVVSDAEPFPGNELDGDAPIRGEAAPGTREAARAADAAAADGDTGDTPVNALRARAAERARARRETREGEQDVDADPLQADSQEDTREAQARTGFVSVDGESEMAAAVRRARAEQARIRREDRERFAATRSDDDDAASVPPVAAAAPTQDEDEAEAEATTDQTDTDRTARIAALRAQRERATQGEDDQDASEQDRSDDPNVLPGFSADTDETEETAEALRDRMAQLEQDEDSTDVQEQDDARAARPTGRIRPIAPASDDEDTRDTDVADVTQAERPRPIQPRPPVTRTPPEPQGDPTITADMVPSSVATDEELEERLNVVEADLRDALRQDLRAEVREDVLAEASQRIDQAIRQTEQEVAQLRTRLGEQEARSDERIAQLRDRLEVLQDRDASANTRGVLILALSNLRGQLDAGQPYERQLDDVERVAPNVTTLREARRFASTGLPTDADLRDRFRAAEREALRLEAGESAEGFFGGMWANIKGLFTVREIGEVEGEDTGAIISRAQAALARGEVGVAVQELDQLDGVAAEAFAPFVEEARAKSATKLQIQRLERAVLAQPAERG